MSVLALLLKITIDWDPILAEFGDLQITWHGIFTAVGIAAGVYLGAWLGRRQQITEDDAYSVALVGVPAGIIGARGMWVLENHERLDSWFDVFRINEGGITVYGAVIGGVLGACAYGWLRKLPVTRGLDAAIFGLLLGMALGRIGDLINGEHVGTSSDLPWAVRYTHPESPGFQFGYTHPATTYEMIGDFLIIGLLALLFVRLWEHRPGITFFAGVVLYSAMRFGVSYLRVDSGSGCPGAPDCPEEIISNWMTFPQVVSTITFFAGLIGLIWAVRREPQPAPKPMPAASAVGSAATRRA